MSRLTKTEYQQHLVDEYASYLSKAVSNHKGNFTLTPVELAKALMRAFEKGAAKGVLYETLNDVERIEHRQTGDSPKKTEIPTNECKDQQQSTPKIITGDDALKLLQQLLGL